MLNFLPLPAVIVDLETTGGRAAWDRITEIGLIEIDADGAVREWSSLVNPGVGIPATIQTLTGITNEMVASAPRFEELAAALHARLAGRLFIAHNARFDYGFLRNEFGRCGLRFSTRPLDTVRLSRMLYPDAPGHSLDAIIERHGLVIGQRHRALGDARAVAAFLGCAEAECGGERLAAVLAELRKRPSLPPYLEDNFDALPETPGVYFFYGEADALLYVGKSKNLQARVPVHFAGSDTSTRALRLAQQVRRVEWEETAGELSALLREARLVKERQPLFNRRLRRESRLCSLRLAEDGEGLLRPEVVFAAGMKGVPPRLFGLFASPAAIKQKLREIAAEHRLCLYATGLEKRSRRPCSARQLQRCAGHCAGIESTAEHNARFSEALQALALRVWPWQGPVGVVEECAENGHREIQVVDNWCWLGSAHGEDELQAILAAPPQAVFDRDTYSLLVSVLFGRQPLPVLPLRYPEPGMRGEAPGLPEKRE
ncbi:MAG: ethanolamine utilization protein [Moraxellaceae bacterium]|jgi:DNA polymerase-3 subunit epsilon|nr:ethanolamine utilization protein [Moraxellaceae bacterium]